MTRLQAIRYGLDNDFAVSLTCIGLLYSTCLSLPVELPLTFSDVDVSSRPEPVQVVAAGPSPASQICSVLMPETDAPFLFPLCVIPLCPCPGSQKVAIHTVYFGVDCPS